MNRHDVYIHAIETAVPDFAYTQDFAEQTMTELVGDTAPKRKFLARIYRGSGIEKRYSVLDDFKKHYAEHTFYPQTPNLRPEPSTAIRNQFYIKASRSLTQRVATKLFDRTPVPPQSVTHLITASCTGFSAPGNDFHLIDDLDLSPNVHRFNLGFMGCFAAISALKLATAICRGEPQAQVLIVNCELCSLHLKFEFELDVQVANAIFSDGASAALVSGQKAESARRTIRTDSFHSTVIPASQEDMTWTINDLGFDMTLSPRVPGLIGEHINPILEQVLGANPQERIAYWAVHPGGVAILDKFAQAVQLPKAALQHSYDVLRQYGNMSSATIMFVLKKFLEGRGQGPLFAAAFGPGLTVESALLDLV